MIGADSYRPKTLVTMTIEKPSGTLQEVEDWLDINASRSETTNGPTWESPRGGSSLNRDYFSHLLNVPQWPAYCIGPAAPFFLDLSSAGGLAGYANGSMGTPSMGRTAGPIAAIFRNGELEETLSQLGRSLFGEPLILDRLSGDVRLRVGSVSVPVPPLNRPTLEYGDAVAALPALSEQGDGVQSFIGLALHVLAHGPDVILVDEPEAFLHPAQARALGRWLAVEAVRRDVQIILSTHDRDVVLGLLDNDSNSSVNMLRIVRDGDESHISQLAPHEVQSVWNDPVHRYSNVLQGLFHKRVVVCEADADCRFYGAALDQLGITTDRRAAADDVLFVPSGSKNRVAAIVAALVRLSVEALAIVDFDVLRVKADVRGIVEAIGATWTSEMNTNYTTCVQLVNQASSWDMVKHLGLQGLAPGPSFTAGGELINALKDVGLLVVPIGEMEDYDKNINLHGAGWVSEALAANLHRSSQPVLDLVESILKPS